MTAKLYSSLLFLWTLNYVPKLWAIEIVERPSNLRGFEKNLLPQSASDILRELKPVYHSRRQVIDDFVQNRLKNQLLRSGAVTSAQQYNPYPGSRVPGNREIVVVQRAGQGYYPPTERTTVVVNVPNDNPYLLGSPNYGRK